MVTSQLRNKEALLGAYEIWHISVKKTINGVQYSWGEKIMVYGIWDI